jgi:hypothetical protein
MLVSVNVPRVEARDLRPEVPLEQSLVISSAHKASLLMLDVRQGGRHALLPPRIPNQPLLCTLHF